VLKQRLITAAILIPAVIWGVFYLPTKVLSVVFAVVIAAGAWEWAGLLGISPLIPRISYVVTILAILVLSSWTIMNPVMLYIVMVIALVWWIGAMIWIQQYSHNIARKGKAGDIVSSPGESFSRLNFGLVGVLVFVPPWVALVMLHDELLTGPSWVMFILVLIWGADSGAYFAGHRWGKRKLAPNVSPGKTWEGVMGACLVTILLAVLGGSLLGVPRSELLSFVLLCLVTTLFSIVGDLLESMIKRQAGVKDSGHILPGHGGVLDRIDSLLSGLPVFAFGLLLQGLVT
jgi:phosphatidate cytidylyltransferase